MQPRRMQQSLQLWTTSPSWESWQPWSWLNNLQKPANYLVNTTKQYEYTMNETHMTRIQDALPAHTVIYIGRDRGFNLSGVPLSGESYILAELQEKLDKTKEVIANICKLKTLRKSLFFFYSAFRAESNIYWQRFQYICQETLPNNMTRRFLLL